MSQGPPLAAAGAGAELWAAIIGSSSVRGIFRTKGAAGDCAREHADLCLSNVLEDMSPADGSAAMAEFDARDIFTEGLSLPYGEGLDFAVRAVVAAGVDTAPGRDVWTLVELADELSEPGCTWARVIAGTRVVVLATKEEAEERARSPQAGWKPSSPGRIAKRVVDKEIGMFG